MFQFSRFAAIAGSVGLPHSEILGSTLLCSSPKLIAALHVLRRLLMPRHPPCALSIFLLRVSTTRPSAYNAALQASTFFSTTEISLRQRTSGNHPKGTVTFINKSLFQVELDGVEPTTSCLQGRRSSQLSYSPGNQSWAWKELNLRPHAYQACALTT